MPSPSTDPAAASQDRHCAVLDALVEMGTGIARLLSDQAHAEAAAGEPVTATAHAYDRVTRGIRRSVLLARRLLEPVPALHPREAARRRILRDVEDAIHRHAPERDADALHEELLDRLDAPELDDELDGRPAEAIIADICRDLGLAAPPGAEPWKRRSPADIAALCARAAPPPGTRRGARLTVVPVATPHRDSG